MLVVRRAGPADVGAWAHLRVALMASERRVEPGTAASAVLEASIAGWLRERVESPSFGAFVAVEEGRVVGSGGISVSDNPPGPGPTTRGLRDEHVHGAGFTPRESYLQLRLGG